jgi:hypothetical protein
MLTQTPQVGVELEELVFEKRKLVFREVGGSFVPIWPSYFADCAVILVTPPRWAIA